MIVPGSVFVIGVLKLNSTKDPKRTVVPNIRWKIIKTLKVFFESNEVLSISNYDEIMTKLPSKLNKTDHTSKKVTFAAHVQTRQ